MQQYFKQLFEYDKWATDALLAKFETQFPQNERIYGLLSHMLSAKRNWLDRCLGLPASAVLWGDRLPDEMRLDADDYHAEWIAFIDELQDADMESTITYTNSQGNMYTDRITDILAHVINHGTHHRGQITMLMKEEGFILPGIDYITYLR